VGIDWADTKHDVCIQPATSDKRVFDVIRHCPEVIDAWVKDLHQQYGGHIAVAVELSKGGVQHWELAGFLGHSSDSTTEVYAKYAPDYMSNARLAIDQFFIELQPLVERTLIFNKDLRVNSVLVGD